jgi:2-phosphosulfolactate phosphatase
LSLEPSYLAQREAVRFEWGRAGMRRAAGRGDILVVVDVLRFTTAVAAALAHGVRVFPCAWDEDAEACAKRLGAEVARNKAKYSLSPDCYPGAPRGTKVVLRSLNGAACARYAKNSEKLFAGALVNASAVAAAIEEVRKSNGKPVSVVAAGERYPEENEDGQIRFAIEDYLAAGAIIAKLTGEKSAEAQLCELGFIAARQDLASLLRGCASGREMIAANRAADVEHAARMDLYSCAPVLREGEFVAFGS